MPEEWRKSLAAHPDPEYKEYLLRGDTAGKPVMQVSQGQHEVMDNPSVVDEYLAKEVRLGRVLGPQREQFAHQ